MNQDPTSSITCFALTWPCRRHAGGARTRLTVKPTEQDCCSAVIDSRAVNDCADTSYLKCRYRRRPRRAALLSKRASVQVSASPTKTAPLCLFKRQLNRHAARFALQAGKDTRLLLLKAETLRADGPSTQALTRAWQVRADCAQVAEGSKMFDFFRSAYKHAGRRYTLYTTAAVFSTSVSRCATQRASKGRG